MSTVSANRVWIRTYSGLNVNPLALTPKDIRISDIAHSLALQPRFVGQTLFPISIAQHSVYVSKLCRNSLKALLHDGSEAYLGDITKWVKGTPLMKPYRDTEKMAQHTIYEAFGVLNNPNEATDEEIEQADRLMVRFEAEQGFGHDFRFGLEDYPPTTLQERIRIGDWHPWDWREAEVKFMAQYRRCLANKSAL